MAQAVDLYHQALAVSQEVNDRRHGNIWIGYLGTAFVELGEVEKGAAYLQQAVAVCRELGDGRYEGRWRACLDELGKGELLSPSQKSS